MSRRPQPPAIDPDSVAATYGTGYPDPHHRPCEAREKRALGNALGLTRFGVNITRLPPGTWSSQRHWHANEDEFIYVLEGELTLVTDAGTQTLGPGMAAGFPAGKADGHHLTNNGAVTAVYLEVGNRSADETVEYSDIDMRLERRGAARRWLHRDGTAYPPRS